MKHLTKYFLKISILSFFIVACDTDVVIEREAQHWEYENTDWENLGYASCGGNSQSPIDIETEHTIISDALPSVVYHYSTFDMHIVDNGHTIQVNNPDTDNSISYNGTDYSFVQFHFHRVSEHQIDGEHAEMELHVVHQDVDGNLLVLGYMITQGDENNWMQVVFDHIPEEEKIEIATGININLMDIQPTDDAYYTYSGSLTTPPCSAAVQFVVFKEHLTLSASQINLFSSYYDDNFRPTQPLNNRFVLEKIN